MTLFPSLVFVCETSFELYSYIYIVSACQDMWKHNAV